MFAKSAFAALSRPSYNGVRVGSRFFAAKAGQAEVVLVGCGAPNRGMGWYHAVQMLEGRYASQIFVCTIFIFVESSIFVYLCLSFHL